VGTVPGPAPPKPTPTTGRSTKRAKADAPKPLDKSKDRPPRWEKRVDALTAYAPHGAGTVGGLTALLVVSNKAVGVAMLLAGQTADAAKTFWERREKRKKEAQDHAD